MQRLFDDMGETPGAANSFLGVCGALFKWAKPRGYVANQPRDRESFRSSWASISRGRSRS
jgi:hypothetical protein